MPETAKQTFVPTVVTTKTPAPARLRDQRAHAGAVAAQLWLANVQLTTVAGAAIIAKTAVAPFERVKVLVSHPGAVFSQASAFQYTVVLLSTMGPFTA